MKHKWIACWLSLELEGWYCSECGEEFIEPEGLGLECFGYMGVERDMNKLLNNEKFSFRQWFDNIFPSSGFAGYSPFYAFTHPHKIIGFCFYEIKFAWQRVFRGWDDRVIWSVDTYLTENVPLWLKELQNVQIGGVPFEFFENREKIEYSNEEHKVAKENWNRELQIMIDGFTASKKIQDCEWDTNEERQKLIETFEKGMKSFTDNYFSLWD